MPENNNILSPEVIGAIAGALITFILAAIWQYFIERRNKIQLTFSKKIDSPLSIPKNELKEKLRIYYGSDEIKDIFYARLTVKNTGQKTVKKQIFRCEFDKDVRSIDRKFPLIVTKPAKEILIEKLNNEDAGNFQANVYRYQIEALAPEQSIQIDFLLDGNNKDFNVSFRPNEVDEVKIIEGAQSSDPKLENYLWQFGVSVFIMIFLLVASIVMKYSGGIGLIAAVPFLYFSLISFRKLLPLLLETITKKEEPDFLFETGNNPYIIVGNSNSIETRLEVPTDSQKESKPQSDSEKEKKKKKK